MPVHKAILELEKLQKKVNDKWWMPISKINELNTKIKTYIKLLNDIPHLTNNELLIKYILDSVKESIKMAVFLAQMMDLSHLAKYYGTPAPHGLSDVESAIKYVEKLRKHVEETEDIKGAKVKANRLLNELLESFPKNKKPETHKDESANSINLDYRLTFADHIVGTYLVFYLSRNDKA